MNNFPNDKKTFLAKLDHSKKGAVDSRILPLLRTINSRKNYYTTSSCSGRVYLWRGSGKKNEMEWLKMSHDLVKEGFFELKKEEDKGLIWLRLEDFILHVCCKNLESANLLLNQARRLYKKSCLLSASRKIIVEIRGSEFLEILLYEERKLLFNGSFSWLEEQINSRFQRVWGKEAQFRKLINNIKK